MHMDIMQVRDVGRTNSMGSINPDFTPLVKGRIENAPEFGGVVCTFRPWSR